MKLHYKGFDRAGQAVDDSVDARDIAEATEVLRRRGIYITEINDTPQQNIVVRKSGSAFGQGKRLKQVAMFLRQLHVLVVTGTPLAESLAALERQSSDNQWKAVVSDIRQKVEQGISLSATMEGHPRYFNAICRGLVAAGESGGNLDAMLERLAVLSRKQVHVRGTVVGAMIYPCLLTAVALGVLTTLMVFVLPRFSALFKTLDTPLPPTTSFLMCISQAPTLSLVGDSNYRADHRCNPLVCAEYSFRQACVGCGSHWVAADRRHHAELRGGAHRQAAGDSVAGSCPAARCPLTHTRRNG